MAQGTTKGVPIDIDPTLVADSDLLVPSQKAIKTYADTKVPQVRTITINGTTQNLSSDISFTVASGGARVIASVTADITGGTAAGTDYVYLVNQTTLVTVTLPAASGNTNSYTIKKIGTGQVNVATTSGTIDGSASPITINVQNVSLTIVTDGTNWFII
jgi:hypothetical protein